jgi:ABC-2 type transport system permease protein
MIQRLLQIIIKEFIQLRNNPEILRIILVMPVIQVFIFGYAAVLDVKNIDTAFLDRDRSSLSREMQDNFKNTSYFNVKHHARDEKEISWLLDREKVFVGIVIPPDFSRNIEGKKTAQVQFIIDGTNSSAAGIITNYAVSTTAAFSNKILLKRGIDPSAMGSIALEQRFLYNPSLENRFFFLPGIFAMVILVIGMPMTARSIVREKEQGTLEQLIVTPITPMELILGKVIPFTLLTLVSSTGILLVSFFWFHLPIRGSLVILYGATLLFLVNCFGIGIFISTISSTHLNPMFYFLNCTRGICLKGVGLEHLSGDLLSMAALGFVIFTISAMSFKKRMD